ncbi:hypothetical protein AYO44_15275 [Planctomycetaceae bacterium SCGC AG-212-F19]|nr:hypothetical protein AYO44_15275 [Planctomycetaceae bacterium SCGC AG-212-F19]
MGVVVGTPDYMAPEQARNSSRADIRSDLYSLGCTFYFLLTGQVPFAGETATEKLLKHCFDAPPSVEQLRPDVPPRVGKIVAKLMLKDPEARYQTPAKLVVALSRPGLLSRPITKPLTKFLLGVLGKGPTVRPDAPARLRKAADRQRWLRLNIAGGAVLLVLLLGFFVFLWLRSATAPAAKATVQPLPASRSTRMPADQLDAKGIPADERFPWQPKELVAVLGKHRARQWGPITCLAASADGQFVASGGNDGAVHLWDAATLTELAVIRDEYNGPIPCISFAPDGKTLAFGSNDGAIYLWAPSKSKPLRKGALRGHRGPVWALAFAPDNRTLASGSGDDTVRLWDPSQLERPEIASTKADDFAVLAIAFGPDGKTLATGGRDRKLRLWDVNAGKLTERWAAPGHQDNITGIVFLGKGDRVASSSYGRYIRIWDIANGKQVQLADVTRGPNATGVFAGDGQWFASLAGANSPIHIWDLSSGEPRDRYVLGAATHGTSAMAFGANKTLLAAGGHSLQQWDLSAGKPRLVLHGRDDTNVRVLALAGDGRTLATGGYNGRVRLWDLGATEPAERLALDAHNRFVAALAFAPDGKLLASAGVDSSLHVWEVNGARLTDVGKFTDFNNALTSVAFAGNGKLLACGSLDRTVHLYDVTSGKVAPRAEVLSHPEPVSAVALDPAGQTLVCLLGEHLRCPVLRIWNLANPKPQVRADLRMPKGTWTTMALTTDGRTLAAGTSNGTMHLFDLGNTEPRDRGELVLPRTRGPVQALAFAPDGQSLAVSVSGRLLLWDVAALQPQQEWELPGVVSHLAFDPDGRHLVTANSNGTVYVLRLTRPR